MWTFQFPLAFAFALSNGKSEKKSCPLRWELEQSASGDGVSSWKFANKPRDVQKLNEIKLWSTKAYYMK